MKGMTHRDVLLNLSARTRHRCGTARTRHREVSMSDDKKRDRALQRRVRERQDKTGESYQAAWRRMTGDETVDTSSLLDHRRIPLPFSTEVPILPGQSAQLTARPQVATFWPDRLLIKNAGSWTIQQLTVEN